MEPNTTLIDRLRREYIIAALMVLEYKRLAAYEYSMYQQGGGMNHLRKAVRADYYADWQQIQMDKLDEIIQEFSE